VVEFGSGADIFTGLRVREGGNLYTPEKGNFGPQLAIDWSPEIFHDKLVVRGGYGLNFNQQEIAITANANGNPPAQGYYNFSSASPTAINPDIIYGISSSPTSLSGFASNPHTIATYNSSNLPTGGNANVYAFGNTTGGLPTPYTQHYSLDLEYEIGRQLVATLGYQGSSSHHQNTQVNEMATALARGVALNPLITNLDYYPNTASANNNSFLAELKHPMAHHIQLLDRMKRIRTIRKIPRSRGDAPTTTSASPSRLLVSGSRSSSKVRMDG
jgi:hypothetical protein